MKPLSPDERTKNRHPKNRHLLRVAMPGLAGLLANLPASLPTHAADAVPHLQSGQIGLVWTLPFAGLLLSIALLPLIAPKIWHHHHGKVALFWGLAWAGPAAVTFGGAAIAYEILHTALLEYLPFIILIGSLYCVTGHIHIRGNVHGSPGLNTGFLAAGTALASVIGTTGAAMLLVRPLIRANDDRAHNTHFMVFFIFLVANIGGALTPVGDPPLFLGFLEGVDFFWPTKALLKPTLVLASSLLVIFFCLDLYLYNHEGRSKPDPTPDSRLTIEGGHQALLILIILAAVIASGSVQLDSVDLFGVTLEWQNILRDLVLVLMGGLSFLLSNDRIRQANQFDLEPIREVAKLFGGIFVTIIPVLAILKAGQDGALGAVIRLVTTPSGQPDPAMVFWVTGLLSSFLDNAPTYLVFFNAVGGDPLALMGPLAPTLMAISMGAVFMGANSYIGNAPNFMVKSMAESRGVRMPGFFGYLVWSFGLLMPLFAIQTWLFF